MGADQRTRAMLGVALDAIPVFWQSLGAEGETMNEQKSKAEQYRSSCEMATAAQPLPLQLTQHGLIEGHFTVAADGGLDWRCHHSQGHWTPDTIRTLLLWLVSTFGPPQPQPAQEPDNGTDLSEGEAHAIYVQAASAPHPNSTTICTAIKTAYRQGRQGRQSRTDAVELPVVTEEQAIAYLTQHGAYGMSLWQGVVAAIQHAASDNAREMARRMGE